jgi:hypothetical protein
MDQDGKGDKAWPWKERLAQQVRAMPGGFAWVVEPGIGRGTIEECLAKEFRTDHEFIRLLSQEKKVDAALHYKRRARGRHLSELVDERSNVQPNIAALYNQIRSWAGNA